MSKKLSIISIFIVTFLWGSMYPVTKLAFSAYQVSGVADSMLFAGIRFTVCGFAITLFAFFKDKKTFVPIKDSWLPLLVSGLLCVVIHYGLLYVGMQYTESSKTAILKQMGTLLYVCFSWLFFKDDKFSIKKIIGVVLGFVGVLAINFTGKGITFQIGDILIVLASLSLVFSNIVSKKVFAKVEPITATGVSQLAGGIVLLIVGFAMGGNIQFKLDWSLLIMVYMCIASIIGYCLWYTVVKNSDLSNMFIMKFAEPVFSCIIAGIILHEDVLKLQYLVAFILIATGIVIVNLKAKSKSEKTLSENADPKENTDVQKSIELQEK